MVNDGSTDNSLDICIYYANNDSKIIIITKENRRLSSAKNTGIKIAKGEYFGFVGSDDYVSTKMFETLYNKAKYHKVDLVCCGFYELKYSDEEHYTVFPRLCNVYTDNYIYYNLTNHKDRSILAQNLYLQSYCSWYKLYKKKCCSVSRLSPLEKYEDTWIFITLFNTAKNILFIKDLLYYYRLNRPGSIMHARFKRDLT